VLVDQVNANVGLAARNIPDIELMPVASVNTYYMLLYRKIVITRAALALLGRRLGPEEKA